MEENKNNKSDAALREEKVLEFWRENKVFEQSLTKESLKGNYVFYDGPPFATGLPHYGHILGSTAKDVVGRWLCSRIAARLPCAASRRCCAPAAGRSPPDGAQHRYHRS